MRERSRFEREGRDLRVWPAGEGETIEGSKRNQVKDSFSVPFRFICHLQIAYEKTTTKMGATGTLIGRRFVLTAAHNLHTSEKLTARRIIVSPARNGDPNSIGEIDAETYVVHPQWKRVNAAFDYALIKLKKEVALDNFIETNWKPLGCWGDKKNGGGTQLIPLPGNQLDGRRVFVAGYALEKGDENNHTMTGGMGIITGVAPKLPVQANDFLLHYTVSTGAGESGSPVWVRDDATDARYLVGIHTGRGRMQNGKFVTNRAVRFTDPVFRQVDSWAKTL